MDRGIMSCQSIFLVHIKYEQQLPSQAASFNHPLTPPLDHLKHVIGPGEVPATPQQQRNRLLRHGHAFASVERTDNIAMSRCTQLENSNGAQPAPNGPAVQVGSDDDVVILVCLSG